MRGKGKDMPDIRNSAPNAIALACLALLYLFGAAAIALAPNATARAALADCRASILNPIAVKNDVVQIRSGMRFSADVPLDAVAAFVERAPETDKAKLIDLGVMGNPSGWLVFAEPVRIETFFGTEKTVEAIGIAVDDKARFSHLIGRAASK